MSALVMLVLGLPCEIFTQAASEQSEAERIWEQAIAAKGGRERLYGVRNMVIMSSGSYKALRFKISPDKEVESKSLRPSGLYREELFVFPSRYWAWDDYRPAVFGLWIHVYDYSRRTKYVITDGEPHHPAETIEDKEMDLPLYFPQLMYLLESNWLKPKPLRVHVERSIDVVETELERRRYDFGIDRSTKLPVSFTSYSEYAGKTYQNEVKFLDYKEVGGIMVPLAVQMGDGHKEYSAIKFNVDYNENIFASAPSIDGGPHAWMKAK